MSTHVTFRLPDGRLARLVPGDLIGRTARCALSLDDGRVSEAHALVSLRGDTLRLLALRGRFAVEHAPLTELDLEEGQVIRLAHDLPLEVVEVAVPDEVLALEGERLPRCVLLGTCSIVTEPEVALLPGWRERADGWLWHGDGGWRLRLPDGTTTPLAAGTSVAVGGQMLRAVMVPLHDAGSDPTRLDGAIQGRLRIVARYQAVHVERADGGVVSLEGATARLLSELVAVGGPASWEVIAREVWRDGADVASLRKRWDATLARLRARLRDGRVRPDLVRSDRTGHVELALRPGDVVVDET